MNLQLGSTDLVNAAAEAYRWRDKHPDLRDYSAMKYRLLREALEVPFDLLDPWPRHRDGSPESIDRDQSGLHSLLASAIQASTEVPDPFEYW